MIGLKLLFKLRGLHHIQKELADGVLVSSTYGDHVLDIFSDVLNGQGL